MNLPAGCTLSQIDSHFGDDSPDPPSPAPRIEGRKASRRYDCPTCGGDLDVACPECDGTHVVALSGGKDSSAMALRLAETAPRNYTFVCTPTGDEPDEMFAHWKHLGSLLGKQIVPVMGGTLDGLIRRQNALPNWRQRWCTRILKIEPYAAWLAKQKRPVFSYVGIRADEPERESGDYTDIPGVTMRFPLREWGWGIAEVVGYLRDRGVTIPTRTDCNLCFFQRLIEWHELWMRDKVAWAKGEEHEERTGHTFRGPNRDTWPASMRGLRLEFEAGRVPKDTRKKDALQQLQCRVCRL